MKWISFKWSKKSSFLAHSRLLLGKKSMNKPIFMVMSFEIEMEEMVIIFSIILWRMKKGEMVNKILIFNNIFQMLFKNKNVSSEKWKILNNDLEDNILHSNLSFTQWCEPPYHKFIFYWLILRNVPLTQNMKFMILENVSSLCDINFYIMRPNMYLHCETDLSHYETKISSHYETKYVYTLRDWSFELWYESMFKLWKWCCIALRDNSPTPQMKLKCI